MNQLQQMFNYQDGQQVRTMMIESAPWFVMKDVCNILEITNVTEALKRLDEDEFSTTEVIDSIGRTQEVYVINEYGLYSIVMTSRKKKAKEFKRWVTHDVLPSIRKTGMYTHSQSLPQPELLEKINELETKIESYITLTSYEASVLQKAINKRVCELEQDKESRGELFRELHREIKDRFGVPSYRDIARTQFHQTISYVKAWVPKVRAA